MRENTSSKPGPTFREYAREGFAETTWMLLVVDFFMGRKGDIQATLWQAMFLPRYLRELVTERLGTEAELLYERQGPAFTQDPGGGGRAWLILITFLIGLPILLTRYLRRRERTGMIPAGIILGLAGLIVWFMALVSTLAELRYNEALFVFFPVDFALPFFKVARRRRYAQIRVAILMLVSILLAVGLLVQPLWILILMVFVPLSVVALPDSTMPRLRRKSKKAKKKAEVAKKVAKSEKLAERENAGMVMEKPTEAGKSQLESGKPESGKPSPGDVSKGTKGNKKKSKSKGKKKGKKSRR